MKDRLYTCIVYTTNYKCYNKLNFFKKMRTLARKATSLSVEETGTLLYLDAVLGY